MHPQPLEFLDKVRTARPRARFTGDVIEAGSLNMNGSAMDTIFNDATYHEGVDWRAGDGVTVVAVFHEYETDRRFDTALQTEMAEHDPYWQESLAKMVELLKPGGNLFFTCAARARPVHEQHVGIDQHYQGLDVIDVLPVLRSLADFEEIICAQGIAPADTYIAALGKKPERVAAPDLSVVIPACQGTYVGRCLKTHEALAKGEREYVVVMNGFSLEEEATVLLMRERPTVLALYDGSQGYPGACNIGISLCHPDSYAVALANDDTEAVIHDWDTRIVAILRAEPTIGIVSPVLNFVANPVQRHGVMPTPELYDVEYLFFPWVAMRTDVIREVGLLDERFGLGNYEDLDYSLRVKDAGYRLVVDPVHVVFHNGHGTFGLLPPKQFDAIMRGSRAALLQKWGARVSV